MSKNVMVFSVHPDDETIGCGGTLLKHLDNGDKVFWVLMSRMDISAGFTSSQIEMRSKEIDRVSQLYGFQETIQFDFVASKLDQYSMSDRVGAVAAIVNKIKPEIVYIPFGNDIHSDHKASFDSLICLTKQFRYPFIKKVLMMEVLSETNFGHVDSSTTFFPNWYVDISRYFQRKMDILKVYDSEFNLHPFVRSYRSVEALSVIRGSEANVEYAESFQLVKGIE